MASSAFAVYNQIKGGILDGFANLNTNTNIKLALYTSASNCNDVTLGSPVYGTLTNEVANGSGYTTGGNAISGNLVSVSGAVATFTLSPLQMTQFTASGGSLTFRYGVLYINATTGGFTKPLLCYTTFDSTPANIVVNDGVTYTITANASGIFTLT